MKSAMLDLLSIWRLYMLFTKIDWKPRQRKSGVRHAMRGVPAIFPRAQFPALRALRGDRGAGKLLRDDPEALAIAWPEGAADVDTPDDLARLTALGT